MLQSPLGFCIQCRRSLFTVKLCNRTQKVRIYCASKAKRCRLSVLKWGERKLLSSSGPIRMQATKEILNGHKFSGMIIKKSGIDWTEHDGDRNLFTWLNSIQVVGDEMSENQLASYCIVLVLIGNQNSQWVIIFQGNFTAGCENSRPEKGKNQGSLNKSKQS